MLRCCRRWLNSEALCATDTVLRTKMVRTSGLQHQSSPVCRLLPCWKQPLYLVPGRNTLQEGVAVLLIPCKAQHLVCVHYKHKLSLCMVSRYPYSGSEIMHSSSNTGTRHKSSDRRSIMNDKAKGSPFVYIGADLGCNHLLHLC